MSVDGDITFCLNCESPFSVERVDSYFLDEKYMFCNDYCRNVFVLKDEIAVIEDERNADRTHRAKTNSL